jgi:hypothetical protein
MIALAVGMTELRLRGLAGLQISKQETLKNIVPELVAGA